MTEDEAEVKMCPFLSAPKAMGQANDCGQIVDVYYTHTPKCCIGSRCMAWRWVYEFGTKMDDGYCGLAGEL